ncbi:serine/threonine protein kinase [Streptomyces solincola]|uniref:non-specific serine/threonine protein kinase n=1 Tax=Streptomyces solincola TaxID=2100817 RepID=A0A2S9Q1U0_9ACTN|nr:protein kinase [Streptomyces solincola]PRH80583.1 serine/threonine protein kinase [Streptomyces solincola]
MASDSEARGGGMSDSSEWGVGGLVGDGRYRLTHRLGRGGMAEVFAAEDVRLGRTVAVKLLRADLAEDPVSKARFTREAQSVAGLNHHAIVAVYDSGEDVVGGQSVPYIVMELVEGRTIRDLLINAEAPPPEQALIIVSGVLEALAYSHQHGIVHRDIKPANVIITHGGAVKVMDFGIARALHGAQSTMTQTGMVMGTPQYLSPEQALGKAVDHRSDLYATGCLLYELLSLRPPFTGETPLSVVYQHVQDIPVPPSQVADVAPPELDGLAMRALAKDPDDRFQSAEEMRGLVQYGLSMLQQQGGHTGAWNTGPVEMYDGGRTQVVGGAAATSVMGAPMHGDTSQGPILPPQNPDDGGYAHSGGRGGGGRGKVFLFLALALVAIVAGVAYALDPGDKPGTKENKPPKTSEAPEKPGDKKSPSPSPEKSDKKTEDPQTGTTGGGTGGDGGNWNDDNGSSGGGWPSDPGTTDPEPSGGTPSSPSTGSGGADGGTTTDGGTDGGTTTDGGTDGGATTDGGTDGGTTTDGTTDGGATTDGTTAGPGATTDGTTAGPGTTTDGTTAGPGATTEGATTP